MRISLFIFSALQLIIYSAPAQDGNLAHYSTKIILQDSLEVSLYNPTMFRVRVSHLTNERFPAKYDISFAMGKLTPWPRVKHTRIEDENYYYILTDSLKLRVAKSGLSWKVIHAATDKQIYPSFGPSYGIFKDGYTIFDNASALSSPSKISRFTHWFYDPKSDDYTNIYLEEDLIEDQFFIYGPSYISLFTQLNELVGPEPLLPKKAYGFFQTQHLACNGTQEQLMEVAKSFRLKDIPLDCLILDFEWGDACDGNKELVWGSSLDWNKNYTKPLTPKQMINKLDSMNIDIMLIHHSAGDFKNRKHQGWTETIYDEQKWWNKYEEKLSMGIRGTWQDTRINDITDSYIYSRTQKYYGDRKRVLFLGSRKVMAFNPWDFRFSTIPTENMIGARRYPFHWTEDCSFSWNELAFQLKAVNNTWGPMSGYSYLASDMVAANWKIQARWSQFSAMSAVVRSHNPKPWSGNIETEDFVENIQITGRDTLKGKAQNNRPSTETAEESIRKYLKLRYRLLPYIYTYAHLNYLTGMPVTRPLLLAYPNDYRCSSDTWPYEFMLGENILVAPVYGDFKSMEIYLPKGNDWIDFNTRNVYQGGELLNYNTSDINILPLFIKKGAIIPMRQASNWIDTRYNDTITFEIYPADSATTFDLIEDDGETVAYQKGAFAKTRITCDGRRNITIDFHPTYGDYAGKPDRRLFRTNIRNIRTKPLDLKVENAHQVKWIYDMKEGTVSVDFVKDCDKHTVLTIYSEKGN